MPFVIKSYTIPQKMKAFLYLIREHGYTHANAQRLISKGRFLVDGVSLKHNSTEVEGEIELVYFEPQSRGVKPFFQTKEFLVFEKESGVLVHPNTMATEYSLLDEIRKFAGDGANAVHRIDMETSGLLMASRDIKSESKLKNLFESRAIKKSYLAWVDGEIIESFEVREPIKTREDYSESKHKVEIHPKGRGASTHFEPLKYDAKLNATLLVCYPHTGRTHQIRLHLFHVKHPILGDPLYGTTFDVANRYLEGELLEEERLIHSGASRLLLHAQSLQFTYNNRFYIESEVDFESLKKTICSPITRQFNKVE